MTDGWRNALIFLNLKINEIVFKKYIVGKTLNRNNSPSSDCREMKYSLLDSPLRDASNGGKFIPLASIDGKLFDFYCF